MAGSCVHVGLKVDLIAVSINDPPEGGVISLSSRQASPCSPQLLSRVLVRSLRPSRIGWQGLTISGFALRKLPPTTDRGQSGGSTACSSRIVRSALLGDGNPPSAKTFSSPSLDQRVRACSAESHTPTM